jgi:hypothetical protein
MPASERPPRVFHIFSLREKISKCAEHILQDCAVMSSISAGEADGPGLPRHSSERRRVQIPASWPFRLGSESGFQLHPVASGKSPFGLAEQVGERFENVFDS